MYTIIDIETTGGSPRHERITEVAIFVHDGDKIVDEFISLVNPERSIPPFITQMTGITNEMVADAPRFFEIAKKIVEITEGHVFVAHNATFDYNFIKAEFQSLGFNFKREFLCTVKTSRKLIPGLRSYSLGNLCDSLGIEIKDRHRAAGDALATVRLFEHLLKIDRFSRGAPVVDKYALKGLHPDLDRNIIKKLPDGPGVYYFYDEFKNLIYIGKSNNIQKRVMSHFNNDKGQRAVEMKARITDISFEETGSDLVAQLLESDEIKKQKPLYNRAQRRSTLNIGLYFYTDQLGYIRLLVDKTRRTEIPVLAFSSAAEAREYMARVVEEFNLCQKLCGLYKSDGACFHFGIGQCRGACNGLEPPEDYNLRVNQVLALNEYKHNNFIILDDGRNDSEYSVVSVQNGKYMGFGYISKENADNLELIKDCIKPFADTRDVNKIIRLYLRQKKNIGIIPY